MVEVQEHHVEASRYLSIVVRLFLRRYWWCFALPVVAFVVLAAVRGDSRFLIVALIVALAAFSATLPLVYYYYALLPEGRWSVLPHRLVTDTGVLTLHFTDENMNPITIPREAIVRRRVSRGCMLLMLDDRRLRLLAVPLSAFSGEQHLRDFLHELEEKPSR